MSYNRIKQNDTLISTQSKNTNKDTQSQEQRQLYVKQYFAAQNKLVQNIG